MSSRPNAPWDVPPIDGPPGEPRFESLGEDRYRLELPDTGVVLEIDRLRRERHQIVGELSVRCDLPGALTIDGGTLSIAEFNLSSVRARVERGRYLASRARTKGDIDWTGHLEELSQRVLNAERRGRPAVDLRELPRPEPDDVLEIDGLALPRRHPVFLFGDGGCGKSYLTLYWLGRLAQLGLRVGLFDWELCGEDHRDRLEPSVPIMLRHLTWVKLE